VSEIHIVVGSGTVGTNLAKRIGATGESVFLLSRSTNRPEIENISEYRPMRPHSLASSLRLLKPTTSITVLILHITSGKNNGRQSIRHLLS
jgi:lactate dehydrogenase-like 2-hydroxyacid dehydrogenase